MLDTIQTELNQGVRKIAKNSLLKKLKDKDIKKSDLSSDKFEELLLLKIKIIKTDGAVIAIGIGISLLTAGLF